jgi:tetratricopeptide (TPR) repeat protein
MDKELNEINDTFQSGKQKQAISELETLIDKFQTDSLLHKAYDLLGDYLNFMGQHSQAVQSWKNALKTLENNPGGVDQLTEQKFFDWINISVTTARAMHRQG